MRIDEIHGLPHYLGYPTTSTSYENPVGMAADYTVAGIAFLSGASDQYPHQRMLAKVVKDQIDSSQNPGDNSLQGWWTRSQTDWSAGAGQEFMEPITEPNVSRRFRNSAGVDVFTKPGNISLLPVAGTVALGKEATKALLVKAGPMAFMASGDLVTRYNTETDATDTATAGGIVGGLVVAGNKLLVSIPGKIKATLIEGEMALTDAFTCDPAVTPQAWWVKNRVLIGVGPKLHENPGVPGDTAVDLTADTPKVDMKDPSWIFTGATSTPKSILLSGHGAASSSILALTLDPNNGELPAFTAPFVVAEFPTNEKVTDVESYLGTFVGIASTAGIRIGQLNDAGGLTYGPLLGSPKPSTDTRVFSSYDRFLSYPVEDAGDGRGGMVIIDLSGLEKDGRAPWSTWIRVAGTSPVTGAIMTGERTAIMVAPGAPAVMWSADSDSLLDTGWLDSSYIRFGTLEGKNFQSVKVSAYPDFAGRVDVTYHDESDRPVSVGSMTEQTGSEKLFSIGARSSMSTMALRFTLTPDDASGPTLTAWSVRAYPAVDNRGQTVLLPLLNFDFEKDQYGVTFGYEGRAWNRWNALMTACTNGANLLVKEAQSSGSYVALADDATFTQTAPPTRASGFGGIIQLVLRTV
jgi:hypothetical protein